MNSLQEVISEMRESEALNREEGVTIEGWELDKWADALEAIAQTTPQPQVPEGYVAVSKREIEKLQEVADNADLYANDYGQGGKPGEQFEEIANVINDVIAAAQEDSDG